jgi:hypothetical protein
MLCGCEPLPAPDRTGDLAGEKKGRPKPPCVTFDTRAGVQFGPVRPGSGLNHFRMLLAKVLFPYSQ